MPAQVLKPSDLAGAYKKVSILNVGPPKSGKTFATATLLKCGASFRPVWYHDYDQGVDAFLVNARQLFPKEDLDTLVTVFRYGVGVERMSQTKGKKRYAQPGLDFINQINKPYDHLDPKTGLFKAESIAAGLVPGVMVIDSLTNFQDDMLDLVLNLVGHELGDKGTDARTDYGAQMGKIKEAINTIKALPCSLVVNAHEQIIQDETTGTIRSQPMVTGKDTLAQTLADAFDIVVYSFSDNGKYEWWIKPQKYIRSAGTRFKVMTETRIPQDYSLII